jgi:hypothetical protein
MAELADATDLKSVSRKGVRVRFPLGPPTLEINDSKVVGG